ncbi:MAG: hypothetical protein QXY26_10020 [Ignisphaera sp.]
MDMAGWYLRGLSSLIVFSILLTLSVALSIYVYSVGIGFLEVSKPISRISIDVVCYNVSNFAVSISRDVLCIDLCESNSRCYLCGLDVGLDLNAVLVLEDRVVEMYIDRDKCIVLLDSKLLQFYGYGDSYRVDGRVKIFDPWTK